MIDLSDSIRAAMARVSAAPYVMPGVVVAPLTVKLIEFLRARLDEDEQVARAGAGNALWHRWEVRESSKRLPAVYVEGRIYVVADEMSDGTAAHIAHWDPARVLAEIAAKRLILDEYEAWVSKGDGEHYYARGLRNALMMLTEAYQDHPDWTRELKR